MAAGNDHAAFRPRPERWLRRQRRARARTATWRPSPAAGARQVELRQGEARPRSKRDGCREILTSRKVPPVGVVHRAGCSPAPPWAATSSGGGACRSSRPLRTDGSTLRLSRPLCRPGPTPPTSAVRPLAWGRLGMVLFAHDMYADCTGYWPRRNAWTLGRALALPARAGPDSPVPGIRHRPH